HAMLGHWILWNHGKMSEAEEHFSAALAAGREHAFVREYQLAALQNEQTEEAQRELLRVANEMRKNNEQLDARTTSRIWSIYYFHLGLSGNDAERKALLAALTIVHPRAVFLEKPNCT